MKLTTVVLALMASRAYSIPVETQPRQELEDEQPEVSQDESEEKLIPQINATHLVPRADGTSFTLAEKINEGYQKPDAQSALIGAFHKYNKPLPKMLQDILTTNDDLMQKFAVKMKATVTATPPRYYDSQYIVPVKIGTPAQTTYLNLDTGSSDLWVFSSDTYKPDQKGHILYQPKKSKTARRVSGHTWKIKYGDGTGASGILYTDRVQIGNSVAKTQAVQSAIEVSDGIAKDKFAHGIMGLAFSRLNMVRPTRQNTFFENVYNELSLPVFTANLQKGKVGNYNFGYINQGEYTGSIHFATVEEGSPWWKFNVGGYQVGKGKYVKYNWPAIVDTGTTLLLAPKPIVDAYYKQVKGAKLDPTSGVFTFPCSSKLPDFVFGFGKYRGKVPGHYINYGQLSGNICYGGLQSSEGIGFAILGSILLKAQFVVFDFRTRSVGFANKKTVPAPK